MIFRSARGKALVVLGVLGAALVPAVYVALKSYRQERAVFFPERRAFEGELAKAGIANLEAAAFGRPGARLRGWYAPATNGATIVFLHGAGGDRTSLLVEARALARAGFGILLFDLPGHGESEGEIRWSEGERASLRAALDWLTARQGGEPQRIGAFGFSLGGYVLAQVGASEPRLHAFVFAGTPSDPVAQARYEHRRFWLLSQLPALWVLERGGLELDVRARDFMPRLAPRPLLVVTGTEDGTVPRFMADELISAATGPRELYVVPRAGHGGYERFAPGDYEAKLVAFFTRSLLPLPK